MNQDLNILPLSKDRWQDCAVGDWVKCLDRIIPEDQHQIIFAMLEEISPFHIEVDASPLPIKKWIFEKFKYYLSGPNDIVPATWIGPLIGWMRMS